MQKLSIWIACVPPKATSQQKGACRAGGGIRFFKKAHVAQAEQDLISLCRGAIPAGWQTIEDGPVFLDVAFIWPWRKSEPKKNKIHPVLAMDVKPDCSNIIKMLEDALTRLNVWRDDSQVARLSVNKFWGDHPGISIEVGRIEV